MTARKRSAKPRTASPRKAPAGDPGPRPTWDAGESRQDYHARVHAWKLAHAAMREASTGTPTVEGS